MKATLSINALEMRKPAGLSTDDALGIVAERRGHPLTRAARLARVLGIRGIRGFIVDRVKGPASLCQGMALSWSGPGIQRFHGLVVRWSSSL